MGQFGSLQRVGQKKLPINFPPITPFLRLTHLLNKPETPGCLAAHHDEINELSLIFVLSRLTLL